MKLSVFVFSLAWAFCLYGQKNGKKKGFDFEEACFKNPSLPYCVQRDFVNKPAPKNGAPGVVTYSAEGKPLPIDAAGIDWRFADPSADALAVLNCSNLPATPLAHSRFDQLAFNGLPQVEAQKVFRALSGVSQVALSVRENEILLMVTGRSADSILPAPEAGWKAMPFGGSALLIGNAEAVDQAVPRLATFAELGELPRTAQQRKATASFGRSGQPGWRVRQQ